MKIGRIAFFRPLESIRSEGLTVLLVTHNPSLAKLAHRMAELRDGRIQNGN